MKFIFVFLSLGHLLNVKSISGIIIHCISTPSVFYDSFSYCKGFGFVHLNPSKIVISWLSTDNFPKYAIALQKGTAEKMQKGGVDAMDFGRWEQGKNWLGIFRRGGL